MKVGFIITAPYQVFHYEKINRHVDESRAFVEVRDEDFGLTGTFILDRMPGIHLDWVRTEDLKKIDGSCDVLVCQTPVPIMTFFDRSFVVAQQYSLAKEVYQYGLWRAQANLNLMYGEYSRDRISRYAHAVAVGNPLLDDAFASPEPPSRIGTRSDLRVLYMPTYGDLSDKGGTLERLAEEGVELTVKAHHADSDIIELARSRELTVHTSEMDPALLINEHDVVVSAYSGAVFDALALRTPVILAEDVNAASSDFGRLSDEEMDHSQVSDLAAAWEPHESLSEAFELSLARLENEGAYEQFLHRYFVNLGTAGKACAQEITSLVRDGEPRVFAVQQVREPVRRYIERNRELTEINKGLERQVHRLQRKRSRLRSKLRLSKNAVLRTTKSALLAWRGGKPIFAGLRRIRSLWHTHTIDVASELDVGLPLIPWQRRQRILSHLEGALDKYGVEHRSASLADKTYCAVMAEDLDRVFLAVKSMPQDEDLPGLTAYLGSGVRYKTKRTMDELSLGDLAAAESFAIGVPYDNGLYSIQVDGAAEVLPLQPRGPRLVAKRFRAVKVDWTREFSPDADALELAPEDDDLTGQRHALESQPIDVVYTWVDSGDPQWRRERDEWTARSGVSGEDAGRDQRPLSANNEERYLNRDELRYSLRSIFLYAPFIRNIYIVTRGQRPHWLNEEVENVHVVTHEEIFPTPEYLPTFNSHAIEASLHLIPGLAEHFLYFNDDVFLGRETTPDDYYTKAGLIKSRFSPSQFTTNVEPSPDAIPTDWASYNALQIMERDFGLHFPHKMMHVPMPMQRSVLQEIEDRYPTVVERTRAARFRSRTDISIPSMFAHYYAIATGRGVEWQAAAGEYVYGDTGRQDFHSKLDLVARKSPTFFCLNSTLYTDINHKDQAEAMGEFLEMRFPIPSPYELPGS